MNALVINKNEYEFPTDVKVSEWSDYVRMKDNPKALVASALTIPVEDIVLVPDGTLHLMQQLLHGVLFPSYVKYNQTVNGHKLISLKTLKLGQFIDLEIYFANLIDNFEKIVTMLYNTKEASNWLVSEVYGCIKYYVNYKTMLYKQYQNLFEIGYDPDEVIEDTHVQIDVQAHMWLDIVMTLCDGKFLDMDAVLDKSVIESFNWLAWNKDKKRKEAELIKQIK